MTGNTGNSGNTGNTGNAGISGDMGGGWFVPDRADFPFVMETFPASPIVRIDTLKRGVRICDEIDGGVRRIRFRRTGSDDLAEFPDHNWGARWYAFKILRHFADEWDPDELYDELADILAGLIGTTSPTPQELEIRTLVAMARDERASALGEILSQDIEFITTFMEALAMTPGSHPRTFRILHIASLIGSFAALHFKHEFNRPRPSWECPALLPPVPVPGHSAYPSGHATQAHLMTRCMQNVVERVPLPAADARAINMTLGALARRVARNREIAGLHYPSDSEAGRVLAGRVFDILSDQVPSFGEAVTSAARHEWAVNGGTP